MSNLDFVGRKFILEFLKSYKDYGVRVEKKHVDPNDLKRSKKNADYPEKAKDIINKIKNGDYENSNEGLYSIPIIVSSDNYVIHGHHRWYAHKHLQIPILAYAINVPRKDVLELLSTHDKSAMYYEIEEARDIRIGKMFYQILEELSTGKTFEELYENV